MLSFLPESSALGMPKQHENKNYSFESRFRKQAMEEMVSGGIVTITKVTENIT